MTYRDYMAKNEHNLSWCTPYSFLNGKVKIAVNEGQIVGIMIDGQSIDCTPENIKSVAQLVNTSYHEYEGWSDTHIIFDSIYDELPCRSCPWFDICDAMDEPYNDENDDE